MVAKIQVGCCHLVRDVLPVRPVVGPCPSVHQDIQQAQGVRTHVVQQASHET